MPSHVIGVDGGSTKTIALVADLNGQILGMARGAGSNATGENVDEPMGVVVQTTREALEKSGITSREAALGMFTLAGADWPEDIQRRQYALEKAELAWKVVVKNDTFGGLRAGTRCPYGVVIAAGTGANTAIITPGGDEWVFGYYQDYGGALDFSKEAIEAVLRAEDGRGAPTLLTELVLGQLGFATVEEMLKALVAKRVGLANKLALCHARLRGQFCRRRGSLRDDRPARPGARRICSGGYPPLPDGPAGVRCGPGRQRIQRTWLTPARYDRDGDPSRGASCSGCSQPFRTGNRSSAAGL